MTDPTTTSATMQSNSPPERERPTRPGAPMLVLAVGLVVLSIVCIIVGAALADRGENGAIAAVSLPGGIGATLAFVGLFTLQPNQAKVLTLFGDYKGTVRSPGFHWANPLYVKRKVSLRVRNFDTGTSKVNDANGSPIEIAAVVVWQVVDTAKATFQVEDLDHFVQIQSETAVRHLARTYPYDSFDEQSDGSEPVTLIGDTETVNASLTDELHDRLLPAGVQVLETRLTDLSYAPEIAEAMLRRQQASAIVAARFKIVEGAVLMVKEAISQLESGDGDDAIPLDADRKATFASNLMTVIASDAPTNPVVNVGTLNR
jgi:regulator of protease activity HflC (stomatin/prohibitin superfamily)